MAAAVLMLVMVWYIAVGKAILPVREADGGEKESKAGYSMLCTQANAAKIIVCTLEEKPEAEETDEIWYGSYYRVLKEMEILSLKEEEALEPLTYTKLAEVLKELLGADSSVEIQAAEGKEDKKVDLKDFMNYYQQVMEEADRSINLEKKELAVLATPTNQETLGAWKSLTSEGVIGFEGLIIDPLIGQSAEAFISQGEILGIGEIKNQEIALGECLIVDLQESEVTLQLQDITFSLPSEGLTSDDVGTTQSFILKQGKITKGENEAQASNETIRVLLSEEGSYTMEKVLLISTQAYSFLYGEKEYTLPEEESWDGSSFEWHEGLDTVTFIPKEEDSSLKILSIEKSSGNPKYYGRVEVKKVEGGYMLINEVDLERYVAGVIPSEMRVSYGIEALKVQAVAARTYAMANKAYSRYENYGADLDDTTASQVYNNTEEDEKAYEAAKATKGLVLKADGQMVSAKFFAASCGFTANSGEVWAEGENFPCDSPKYLSASKQYLSLSPAGDLREEANMAAFIKKSPEELDALDADSPWFRWQVQLTAEELNALVVPALEKINRTSPLLVKCQQQEKWVHQEEINLGSIKAIKVGQRGTGGNSLNLIIKGENETVKVSTEYLIRCLFSSNAAQGLTVLRSDGTEIKQMSLLPSAFFVIEPSYEDDALTEVILYGGGFGHGVGMSQDGAKGMAERGYDYKKIISHYYPEAELVVN